MISTVIYYIMAYFTVICVYSQETQNVSYIGESSPMFWADRLDPYEREDKDIFFDRIVGIVKKDGSESTIVPAVFINHSQILTSYNPFRNEPKDKLNEIEAVVLTVRMLNGSRTDIVYKLFRYDFICAKPVVPNYDLASDQWHGTDGKHSPVHDLLVFGINETINFLDPNPNRYNFKDYRIGTPKTAGPLQMAVAKLDDYLEDDLKFASIGFINEKHIKESRYLNTRIYEYDDKVIRDCDEWMPREWGHFICILNLDFYPGVGSGAMLIYNDTLYGVGSFLLKKGNESVLAFTDVRPYRDLIFKTCYVEKKEEEKPKH